MKQIILNVSGKKITVREDGAYIIHEAHDQTWVENWRVIGVCDHPVCNWVDVEIKEFFTNPEKLIGKYLMRLRHNIHPTPFEVGNFGNHNGYEGYKKNAHEIWAVC